MHGICYFYVRFKFPFSGCQEANDTIRKTSAQAHGKEETKQDGSRRGDQYRGEKYGIIALDITKMYILLQNLYENLV